MKKHNLIEVKGFLEHETGDGPDDGAFLVYTKGNDVVEDGKKVWLPKHCTEKHEADEGFMDYYVFEITEALAIEKELI